MPEIDHSCTDEPICPYCDEIQGDASEMRDGKHDCDFCGKTFVLWADYTVTYTTEKIE